jgi:hypothetical protein
VDIRESPLLYDLAIGQSKNRYLLNRHFPSGGRNARERSSLRAGGGEPYDDPVALGHYVVHALTPVRERGPVLSDLPLMPSSPRHSGPAMKWQTKSGE